MAFRWRADDILTLNVGEVALCFFRGSGPVLLRNPIFLLFLRGGGPDPLTAHWILPCLYRTVQCLTRFIDCPLHLFKKKPLQFFASGKEEIHSMVFETTNACLDDLTCGPVYDFAFVADMCYM